MASCGGFEWPVSAPDGTAVFSIRPEAIHLASEASFAAGEVRFRARIVQQTFAGSSEQLEVDCAGRLLRVRLSARGPLAGEHDFAFSPADAVPVRD
jgi:hypothetical protein